MLKKIQFAKFEVTLAGFNTFGCRAPDTLYAAIEKNEALDLLQDKVSSRAGEHASRRVGLHCESPTRASYLGGDWFRHNVTVPVFTAVNFSGVIPVLACDPSQNG